MTQSQVPPEQVHIPDPDAIRSAIDVADERAKLLRRLLRLAMRLRVHLTTGDQIAIPPRDQVSK